jgi:hypothetical protein
MAHLARLPMMDRERPAMITNTQHHRQVHESCYCQAPCCPLRGSFSISPLLVSQYRRHLLQRSLRGSRDFRVPQVTKRSSLFAGPLSCGFIWTLISARQRRGLKPQCLSLSVRVQFDCTEVRTARHCLTVNPWWARDHDGHNCQRHSTNQYRQNVGTILTCQWFSREAGLTWLHNNQQNLWSRLMLVFLESCCPRAISTNFCHRSLAMFSDPAVIYSCLAYGYGTRSYYLCAAPQSTCNGQSVPSPNLPSSSLLLATIHGCLPVQP